MTAHVADESVVDLALGGGSAQARAHAGSCETCARRVQEARAALELARGASVPEPSPLYWDALRSGVSRRIAEDKPRTSGWAILLPLSAAAALVAVLWGGPATRPPTVEPTLPGWSALPAAEEDEGLRVLEGLALASGGGFGEWDEASGLGAYLAGLTDDETQALAERLRNGGRGGES